MKKILLVAALVMAASPALANVPTLSGGIGEEEQAQIEQAQGQYNLKVLFAGVNGDYLSDITYTVRNSTGDIMTHGISKGPYLLLKLPAGSYAFEADYDGQVKSQKFSVKDAGLKKLDFRFRQDQP
ncbi:MAG: hypothetical protein AB7G06_05320 [Bdellovibrionales bacterium]